MPETQALGTRSLRQAIRRDFAANPMLLDRVALASYRIAHHLNATSGHTRARRLSTGGYRVVKNLLAIIHGGGGIPITCVIGPGLRLPHHLNGVFLGSNVVIGDDVILFHQVTIGAARYAGAGEPIIGDRVVIYPGAKIVGAIRIGADAVVGANAVVVRDVPPGATVAGVPARVVGGATDTSTDPVVPMRGGKV